MLICTYEEFLVFTPEQIILQSPRRFITVVARKGHTGLENQALSRYSVKVKPIHRLTVFSSFTAGHLYLQRAEAVTLLVSGAKTLLVWEEENLLDPKPRGIAQKGPTLLAQEDPSRLRTKPVTLLDWRIPIIWRTLLGQRAQTQSTQQNSRRHPAPLLTSRATLLVRRRLIRLHASKRPTPLRIKNLIHCRPEKPTRLTATAERSLRVRVRALQTCQSPVTPRRPKPLTNIACSLTGLPLSLQTTNQRWSETAPRPSVFLRRPCHLGKKRRRFCRRSWSYRARRWGGSAGGPTRRWHRHQQRPQRQKRTTRPPRRRHLRRTTSRRHLDQDVRTSVQPSQRRHALCYSIATAQKTEFLIPFQRGFSSFNLGTVRRTWPPQKMWIIIILPRRFNDFNPPECTMLSPGTSPLTFYSRNACLRVSF